MDVCLKFLGVFRRLATALYQFNAGRRGESAFSFFRISGAPDFEALSITQLKTIHVR